MELHHIRPLSQGGANDLSNLRAMTRGDNYRLNHPLENEC